MAVKIDEDTLGIWFVEWDGGNLMAFAWRTRNSGAKGCFRTRRTITSNPNEDERNWFGFKHNEGAPVTDEQMISTCSTLATITEQQHSGKKWELLRGAKTFDQFLAEFRALPFTQFAPLSAEECRISTKHRGADIEVTAVHEPTGITVKATGPAARKDEIETAARKELGNLVEHHGSVGARRS